MKIVSPVTGKNTAVKVATLSTKKIIDQYRTELGIDVSRFFREPEIDIYECGDSKYRFYYPLNILGDSTFYSTLQNVQGEYYPKNKWEYNHALEFIKPGDKILEIGCGVGHFLEQAKNIFADPVGLELNSSAVEICKSKHLNAHNQLLSEHAKDRDEQYDVVCAFQVLEHIPDVKEFITDCLKVLRKDGYLIFAVPNSNPYLFRQDIYHTLNVPPHHAGLWNAETMKNLEKYFDITIETTAYEPLKEYKKWYQVQLENYKEKNPVVAILISKIPRQVYKPLVRLFRNRIQGTYLIAVFKKN